MARKPDGGAIGVESEAAAAPPWWRPLAWEPWGLALAPVRSRDAVRVAAAITDEIARYLHLGTAEQMRAGTPAWAAESDDLARRGEAYRYLVIREGRFAGAVELRPDAVRGHVGYWLRRPERGRGLATRATQLLVPIAFEGMRLPAVDFVARAANERSIAVMERVGARLVSVVPGADGEAESVRYRLARRRYRPPADAPSSLAALLNSSRKNKQSDNDYR